MELQRHHPLATVQEAANLFNRYQAGAGFRAYVRGRMNLVVPAAALILLGAIACTAGAVVAVAGARAFLMLFVLLLAPSVLIGNLLVQAYLLFGWLENRAIAKGLKHGLEPEGPAGRWLRKNLRAEVGKFPPVPWVFAAAFVLLPLLLTAAAAPALAAGLVDAYAVAIVLFARLDR
jgi:hypothetical protein